MGAKLVMPLLALCGFLHATTSTQHTVSLNDMLRRQVPSYELKANNLVEALARIAEDFHVPMGVEWVDNSDSRHSVSLPFKATTLEGILNTIASQKNLCWVADKGTIRVSSQLIADNQNPFKIKIKKFTVQSVPTEAAWRQLHETVKRTISPPQPQLGTGVAGVAGSGFSNSDDPQISLVVEDLRVDEILDRLVAISARKIWVATFLDTTVLTRSGYRKTGSLWTKVTSTDEKDQPFWDMFHWGERIPTTIFENHSN